MKTLEIDMENCFGISKFEHKFDFADDTCVLIMHPGMMKVHLPVHLSVFQKMIRNRFHVTEYIRKEKPIALLNAMGNLLIQSQFSLRMLNPTLLQIIE